MSTPSPGSEKPYNLKQPIPLELVPRDRCDGPPPAELIHGLRQFNQREYFECHETLELLWLHEPTPLRTLYKGILQIGVGCYHLLRDNYRGSIIKLETGAAYITPFAPRCMGIDLDRLLTQSRRLRAIITEFGPEHCAEVDRSLLPIISWRDAPPFCGDM